MSRRPVSVRTLGAYWLLSLTFSFLLGALFLLVLPSRANIIWDVGTLLDVALTVAFGFVLGRAGEWPELPIWSLLGVLVVVGGFDLLSTVQGWVDSVFIVIDDIVAVFVGLIGMTALLLAGSIVGLAVRRCRCPRCRARWISAMGSQFS